MEEFLVEMAEILEEDTVNPSDELSDFESWDSLAGLSVVAMADANFGANIMAQDLRSAVTVEDLYQLIISKKAA
jgi:acyl carrier protein